MMSFDYHPRTRVIFGQGAVSRIGLLARDLGFRRTLVVADRGLLDAGHVQTVLRLLTAAGVTATGFHEFGVNPDTAMVEAARAFAAPLDLDSLVALGGGSSIYCAKAVNVLVTNGGRIRDYQGEARLRAPALPMIAVPTTAGTGAEAHRFLVVKDAATRATLACAEPGIAPRLAILDPALTLTAPAHVTAMAGFDAIAHSVESAVSTRRTPMSDTFARQAWQLLNGAFERVLLHPSDLEARATMLVGSDLAGMAIEQSMLGAAHACAQALTARSNLAHGLALAILLPHVVRWNASVANERYAALLGAPRRRVRDEEPAESLARRLEDLAAAAGLGLTLSDAGVSFDSFEELAKAAAEEPAAAYNARPFDAAGALEIFRAAH